MSLVIGGQKFLRLLVGWALAKGDENKYEDEVRSEDRIEKN